jgi:GH25 family lysozyme M1 (1,4-beta-N-acetylmuramidase)
MAGRVCSGRARAFRACGVALVMVLSLVSPAVPARAGEGQPGTAGSSGDAGASGPAPRTILQPVGSLPGVDVSHWQETIDWGKVAADGQRFVIAKATEGRSFDDPMYASYRAGAEAQGLAFTAYHFARPDATANDAIAEADHFVAVAGLGPGNLIPVLDIERTGGLDPLQLTEWVLDWLGEVAVRLGVRPMVYTSPNGWETRFADTTAVADAGYSVLWVAHWNVSSPTVPANGWEGNGWTMWQHTDCASVPGISGCVDHDWFAHTSFDPVTIRGLTVSVGSPGGVVTTAPSRFACSSTCSANFDPGTLVTLTATPNGAVFLGWGGACSGTAGTCTVTMDADRSVMASFATDTTPPTATIAPRRGAAGPVTATFSEIVHGVTRSNLVLGAEAGSAVAASLTCRSGAGAPVSCSTGKVVSASLKPVEPLVPGQVYEATVDPPGATPIVDRVGNPAPTTTATFAAPADLEQGSPVLRYGWGTVANRVALGRSYVVEHLAGASARFAFRGTAITWYTVAGPSQGLAVVSIDGRRLGTANGYATTTRFRVAHTFRGLGGGPHTITITALGRKGSPRGTDRRVAIDGFGVGGEVVRTPPLAASWRTARAGGASGGTLVETDVAGASVELTFRGTAVDWITAAGPDQGRAEVSIDGTVVKVVDGYAEAPAFGVRRSFGGLPEGLHTLRIVVLGTSRRAATGSLVRVDGFAVSSVIP